MPDNGQSGDAGEKTERATPRRRADAEQEGRVPRSIELSAAAVLFAGTLAMSSIGATALGRESMDILRADFSAMSNTALSPVCGARPPRGHRRPLRAGPMAVCSYLGHHGALRRTRPGPRGHSSRAHHAEIVQSRPTQRIAAHFRLPGCIHARQVDAQAPRARAGDVRHTARGVAAVRRSSGRSMCTTP